MDDWIRKSRCQLPKIAKTTEIRKWNVKGRKHHAWVGKSRTWIFDFTICNLSPGNYLFVDV